MSFNEFKSEFYSRVNDFSIFDCNDINLLKVVLDGLKVDYVKKDLVNTELFKKPLIQFFKQSYRKIKYYKKIKTAKQKIKDKIRPFGYLFIDSGRIVSDYYGVKHSQFFSKIQSQFKSEEYMVVLEDASKNELYHDFTTIDIFYAFGYLPVSPEIKKMKTSLLRTYTQIQRSNIFDDYELLNIQVAFNKFYTEYLIFQRFSEIFNPKKVIFTCHYHREGLIYAFKKRNIECIELQHGLIAEEDIFYVFPKKTKEICQKSLFANKIVVFGEYWKTILLKGSEYNSVSVLIGGYFPFDDYSSFNPLIESLKKQYKDKEVLLVTTQTFMHDDYISYIKDLAKKMEPNQFIIVKPHPAEKKDVYENELKNLINVSVLIFPTEILFKIAKIHLSIYSTTLFDCVKHNIFNYALNIEKYSDYVNAIIKSGVANLINYHENPFRKASKFLEQPQDFFFKRCDLPGILNEIVSL